MSKSIIRGTFCGFLIAVTGITGAAQTHIEAIHTAMHHITAIQVPEAVENVAVGSAQIHVEWRGDVVLLQPTRAGVKTNMIVFTHSKSYDYEVMPANDPSEMTMVVREPAPPRPAPPVLPTHAEVQRKRDALYTKLLMTAQPINTHDVRKNRHDMSVKVVLVSQDDSNFYIRLHAVNGSKVTYRLQTPKVMKLDPAFGIDVAYDHIYRQLGKKALRKFRSNQMTELKVHASSLTMQDMPPDTQYDFVIAIEKPKVTPAMFEFIFPSDDGKEVSSVAIF